MEIDTTDWEPGDYKINLIAIKDNVPSGVTVTITIEE